MRFRFPLLSVIQPGIVSVSRSDITSKLWFALLLTLLITSLAQPVRFSDVLPDETRAEAIDLILVVNTSVSMVLKDYTVEGKQIDRMQMTQQLLLQLVDKFPGRRIALVVLGRPASIWLPLIEDKSLVKHAITRLRTTLGGRGSDIGETLELVRNKFRLSQDDISASEKVVLLITDGYQQLGPVAPDKAVQNLLNAGFTLHTLAIGSTTQPDVSLGKSHLIYAPVDLPLMQKLALIGNGKMIHAQDQTVVTELLKLFQHPVQKSRPESTLENNRRLIINLYHYPLALALLLLLYLSLPLSAKIARE